MTVCSPLRNAGSLIAQVTQNTADIAELQGQVAQNTGDITGLQGQVTVLENATFINLNSRLRFEADTEGYRQVTVTSSTAGGFPLTTNVVWQDGNTGVLTAVEDPVWEGAVRSYVVTYGSPVTKTLTQPNITRSSVDGRASVKPVIIIT